MSFLRKFTLCLYSYSVFCAYSKFAKFCDYSRRAVQNTFTILVLRFVIFSRSALFESWFRALPYPGMTIAGGCLKITQQFFRRYVVAKIRVRCQIGLQVDRRYSKSESSRTDAAYRSCQPASPHSAAAAYARVYPSALLPDGLNRGFNTLRAIGTADATVVLCDSTPSLVFLLSGGQLIL